MKFFRTGEFRAPKMGEWFEEKNGEPKKHYSDCFNCKIEIGPRWILLAETEKERTRLSVTENVSEASSRELICIKCGRGAIFRQEDVNDTDAFQGHEATCDCGARLIDVTTRESGRIKPPEPLPRDDAFRAAVRALCKAVNDWNQFAPDIGIALRKVERML
jgi:hypothetical protein